MFDIPSCTVEDSHPSVCFFRDADGYFLILFREDKELNRLAGTIDDPVKYDTDNEQGYETEDDTAPVMKNEVTGTNDEYISNHDHSSKCHVLVFIDDSSDDICSSGTSVIVEYNTKAYAA